MKAQQDRGHGVLGERERRIVAAIAEGLLPAGTSVEPGGEVTVRRLEAFLGQLTPGQARGVRALLWSCEGLTLGTHGRPFSRLPAADRERLLDRWASQRGRAGRSWLRALVTPLKAAHLDDVGALGKLGCRAEAERPVSGEAPPRWLQQVTDGRTVDDDLTLECEVVVIGTGAGGAAAAHELASRGRAVLLLEEGDYHRRGDFNGRASHALRRYYRDGGISVAMGNATAPVWAGRMVGGSTAINSGTCYRAPERTFRYWRERHGLPGGFSAEGLDPYYARVEAMLQVEHADPRFVGGVGRVIARGADALGMHEHGPLPRNAPGCDGQGMCCYGCPTGAKRSTDVSYIPAALDRGAQLITGAHVDTIDVVAGRARGVRATLSSGRSLRVQAQAVVVAGGALMTPLLLERSGVGRSSGWLGRNLSIHPATQVLAQFDEVIDMGHAIPQGYGVESLASEGLMFEGCSTPADVMSVGVPWTGHKLTELLASYRHLAAFGFMIQDHSRGRVWAGPGGSPLLTYSMNDRDVALCQRGLASLTEIFLAAGAKRVFPFALGHEEVRTAADVQALRTARLRAGDFSVAGFHPLGTCRLGTDPRRSCVGPDHQLHDTEGLYVCDGSVMPSSLGVNPQLTIMALSLRAAEGIDAALG